MEKQGFYIVSRHTSGADNGTNCMQMFYTIYKNKHKLSEDIVEVPRDFKTEFNG